MVCVFLPQHSTPFPVTVDARSANKNCRWDHKKSIRFRNWQVTEIEHGYQTFPQPFRTCFVAVAYLVYLCHYSYLAGNVLESQWKLSLILWCAHVVARVRPKFDWSERTKNVWNIFTFPAMEWNFHRNSEESPFYRPNINKLQMANGTTDATKTQMEKRILPWIFIIMLSDSSVLSMEIEVLSMRLNHANKEEKSTLTQITEKKICHRRWTPVARSDRR